MVRIGATSDCGRTRLGQGNNQQYKDCSLVIIAGSRDACFSLIRCYQQTLQLHETRASGPFPKLQHQAWKVELPFHSFWHFFFFSNPNFIHLQVWNYSFHHLSLPKVPNHPTIRHSITLGFQLRQILDVMLAAHKSDIVFTALPSDPTWVLKHMEFLVPFISSNTSSHSSQDHSSYTFHRQTIRF